MPSKDDESIPSAKLKVIENEKVVIEPRKNNNNNNELKTKKKGLFIYLLVTEGLLLILAVVFFSLLITEPFLFFNFYTSPNDLTTQIYILQIWTYILIFPFSALALLNSYLHIYLLEPKYRLKIYILRILSAVVVITLSSPMWDPYNVNFANRTKVIMLFVFILYCFASNIVLKTYLLVDKKPISMSLFRKTIAGSPSELEWRKFDSISGYFAVFLGIIFLQMFWLIYHLIIRKILIKHAKRKLIVESIDYEADTNMSTVALELGLSLEEVIFLLKQLVHKRELVVEFTRYGAILKEIRSPKWLTLTMQEKHDKYLSKQKLTEIELKANKFFDLAEREKILSSDFKRIMDIRDDFLIEDLSLLLPNKVMEVKKVAFSQKKWIHFNLKNTLMKKEKIIKTFVDNSSKIFND
ncbi:MAG: hypothetical protein ACXABK_04925 [Candidatus Heimdallarchaeaceae archaeon]|jgi:hypothetical protein